jgi:hypothetical protein
MLQNVTDLSHDQSLEAVSEDPSSGECDGRSDVAISLLSPVHLLDKRIIPVAKVHVPVSLFAWITHTSGGKKQRGY